MKQIQHFLISDEIVPGKIKIQDRELANQMLRVLRMRIGDCIKVMDGKGKKAEAKIIQLDKKFLEIDVQDIEICKIPSRKLRLYCALSKKPATFEIIVQKATELGVDEIVAFTSERCQVREIHRIERLQSIIKEATEQSERCFAPTIRGAISFEKMLSEIRENNTYISLAGDPWDFDSKLAGNNLNGNVNLIIGPEGGLSKAEIENLRGAGAVIFQIGENILRMETAAIAAISVVQFI